MISYHMPANAYLRALHKAMQDYVDRYPGTMEELSVGHYLHMAPEWQWVQENVDAIDGQFVSLYAPGNPIVTYALWNDGEIVTYNLYTTDKNGRDYITLILSLSEETQDDAEEAQRNRREQQMEWDQRVREKRSAE